jgi:hypothetical protein
VVSASTKIVETELGDGKVNWAPGVSFEGDLLVLETNDYTYFKRIR